MSDIFKSYLSEDERDIAIEESTYKIQMAKLNAMYEKEKKNLELNMLEAEAKVLTESGTYDDLDYLYEEANAEAAKKKEGIIAKIVGVVKTIWGKITSAITNLLSKCGIIKDEVEVDANDEKRMNALNAVWGKVKQVLNFVRNNGGKIAVSIAVLGTGIIAGLELFGKEGGKVKKPSSVVKGWIQNIKSKAGEVTSALSSAGGDGDEKKKGLEILSEVGEKLKSWIDSLTSKLTGAMSSAKEAITGKSDTNGEKNDGVNPGDKEGLSDKQEGSLKSQAKELVQADRSGKEKGTYKNRREKKAAQKKYDKVNAERRAKADEEREKKAQAEQKKKDLDNGKYPGDKGLSDKREGSPRALTQELVQADRFGKEKGRYKDFNEEMDAMDNYGKVDEERHAKYGKKETKTEEPEVNKNNETAENTEENQSHVANDSEENKNNKKKKKKQRRFRNKQSVSQESFEEEIDDETVLESTDTIFGYDLSNEIEIQENEVYESVMEEIDDLLGDL